MAKKSKISAISGVAIVSMVSIVAIVAVVAMVAMDARFQASGWGLEAQGKNELSALDSIVAIVPGLWAMGIRLGAGN